MRPSKVWASAIITLAATLTLHAQDARAIEPAQQNAIVQKYCGSCHSDALMYGGLSVEHFDAAHVDPTLAAMLLSKITNGHTPKDIAGATTPSILNLMKASAMGAAGKGVPDEATQVAFAKALSAQATGADQWNYNWTDKPSRTLTASIVREHPSAKRAEITDSYRLILTCRTDTHEGELKLVWANGVPEEGRPITIAVDGKAPFTHKVEGGKKQGNGDSGPGATILYPNPKTNMPLPAQTLTIGNLFADETVVFPFDSLSQTVRQDLSTCFTANDRAY